MNFFKILGANLIAIFVAVLCVVTAIAFSLKSYTRHGQSMEVPDVRGLKIEDAIRVLQSKRLRYSITDSLYFEDKPKLSVLEQNPAAKSAVKEGRVIYVTINTNTAPKVALPNMLDISLRQASSMLVVAGFKQGELIYKPDIAKDAVLDVLYLNKSIQPGTKIPKGTVIDLVIGSGAGGEEIDMPDLSGLTLSEARNLMQSSALNIGSVVYMGGISDSTSAKVVRQAPAFTDGATIKQGQTIDLFLRQ